MVCEQQKTWILFIYMAGRPYQFASDEGICCKLGTIAPLPKLPPALGIQSPTHEMSLRRIALAQLPIFKSCFDRSVMMFVNRAARPRRIGSCTKDRSYRRIWKKTLRWSREMKVGVETGSQLPSPPLVTFVTFTRLSRITLCALSHKFNLVFPLPFFPRRFPGLRFQMPADSDCVYRVCNGQSGAAFVCFKYSLIELDFRNFKSTEPASLVAAHCFGKQLYCVLCCK